MQRHYFVRIASWFTLPNTYLRHWTCGVDLCTRKCKWVVHQCVTMSLILQNDTLYYKIHTSIIKDCMIWHTPAFLQQLPLFISHTGVSVAAVCPLVQQLLFAPCRDCVPVWGLGWHTGPGWLLGLQRSGEPVGLHLQRHWERGETQITFWWLLRKDQWIPCIFHKCV